MTVSSPPQAQQAVSAILNYVKRPAGEKPIYYYLGGKELPPGVQHFTNYERLPEQATITDLRSAQQKFSLRQNGFTLAKLAVPAEVDWDNKASVQSLYYPAAEKLIRQETGASRVHIFDSTRRKGSIRQEAGPVKKQMKSEGQQPSTSVHVDYSLESGVNRLHQLLPEEASELQKTPFAIIQMWQPIRPVHDSPLALMDAASLDTKDLVPVTLHFPDRTGQTAAVARNSNQRWYYAQGMQMDEVYVWIGYHSRRDWPRFTPHTSFEDPTAPPDAPDRESIEIRAYAFWQNDEPCPPAMEF